VKSFHFIPILLLSIQCGQPQGQSENTALVVSPAETDARWVGEYLSGDGGNVGVFLEVKADGQFHAQAFSCVSDALMDGVWVASADWIEFFPSESKVVRGAAEEFSSLPRMKMEKFMNVTILLPNGDKSMLKEGEYRISEVYSKGTHDAREAFLDTWFGSISGDG
jgi:hypothetical protein